MQTITKTNCLKIVIIERISQTNLIRGCSSSHQRKELCCLPTRPTSMQRQPSFLLNRTKKTTLVNQYQTYTFTEREREREREGILVFETWMRRGCFELMEFLWRPRVYRGGTGKVGWVRNIYS